MPRYFIHNKYFRWYMNIISDSRTRTGPNSDVEQHHIIPRCMNGSDRKENLVYLSFREHFLVHWLLTKCVIKKYKLKMFQALAMMRKTKSCNKRLVASWQYSIARKASRLGQIGRYLSEETKLKISLAKMGHLTSFDTRKKRRLAMQGRIFSAEHKAKLSIARKGKKLSAKTKALLSKKFKGIPISEERRLKMLGRVISAEHKNKISIALKGRPRSPKIKERIRLGCILREQRKREGSLGL